jgi:autotransporter-associated beta strand protein
MSGPINGFGGLIKTGAGLLQLNAYNTYNGPTIVRSGILLVNGQTDVGAVTVSNGTLGGSGLMLGAVTVENGGVLAPGNPIGALTILNALTLQVGSTTRVEVNKTDGTNDLVNGLTSITYGGNLVVTNLAGALTTNDVFKLFDAGGYSGAFASVTPAPGPRLAWDTNTLANDGILRITVATGPNPSPTNITFSVASGNLTLAWPEDHLGWALQAQTNNLNVGLSTNWFTLPETTVTNQITVPINPLNGSVFFRLRLLQ